MSDDLTGGEPQLIADRELRQADLPDRSAPEAAYQLFALSIDGYDRAGGFNACAELANAALEQWAESGMLPNSLHDLRLCLFFEQRRWRQFGSSMDEETLRYVRALVDRMRDKVPA